MAQPAGARPVVQVDNSGGARQINVQDFDDYQANNGQVAAGQQDRSSKDLFTKMITMIAEGQGQGRGNVPAYNRHEQAGMGGIQDPAALGQATNLPLPFDQQYDKTANLLAIVNNIGPDKFNMSNKIVAMADAQQPQMKAALDRQSTIYEPFPNNFYANRMNIALEKKRVYSMYAFV